VAKQLDGSSFRLVGLQELAWAEPHYVTLGCKPPRSIGQKYISNALFSICNVKSTSSNYISETNTVEQNILTVLVSDM